jgi:hypothetical protein
MIEDGWFQNGRMKKYAVPLYALCDLEETAAMLEEFIDRNISTYITGAVSRSDPLILDTYVTAFKHYGEAQVSKRQYLREPTDMCGRLPRNENLYLTALDCG